MISKLCLVNFGISKAGLTTVGYTLLNSNDTEKQARTITGVFEVGTNTGIYGYLVSFDDDWIGTILWDTGEVSPRYGVEEFNYQVYSGTGGGAVNSGYGLVVDNIWTREEKEKLFNKVNKILSLLGQNVETKQKLSEVLSATEKLSQDIKHLKETQKFADIIHQIKILESLTNQAADKETLEIKDIKPYIDGIVKTIKENNAIGNIDTLIASISSLQESIKNISKEVEISIKVGAKLLKTTDLEDILKEAGQHVPRIAIK